MNYAEIKFCDIANGPGVRTSLFVSGCRIHCKNCFNQGTWDFSFGDPFDERVQQLVLDSLEPRYVHGITILGGEPMEPENQRALLPFLRELRRRFPLPADASVAGTSAPGVPAPAGSRPKTIWCFTGYTLGAVAFGPKECEATGELLDLIDVLVDGPYVEELHDMGLRFRGSTNQRIIDMAATRAAWEAAELAGEDPAGVEPLIWEDDPVFSTHTMP